MMLCSRESFDVVLSDVFNVVNANIKFGYWTRALKNRKNADRLSHTTFKLSMSKWWLPVKDLLNITYGKLNSINHNYPCALVEG